jgi:hypothetical protein
MLVAPDPYEGTTAPIVIGVFTDVGDCDTVRSTHGVFVTPAHAPAAPTVTVLAFAGLARPALSLTTRVTEKVPARPYVWLNVGDDVVCGAVLSPNVHK